MTQPLFRLFPTKNEVKPLKGQRWLAVVFFAAFLLIGLLTAGDYGATWDERDEMDILRMNLWEYTHAAGGDEAVFERYADAFDDQLTVRRLTPISQSVEQDHGICAFYPMASVVLDETLTEAQRSERWHGWCWVVFTLGAFALYQVCRQLGMSALGALWAPVFLLVSPRFFSQAHFNNKDIALMALVLCTLWQALRLMKRPSLSTGVLFSLFGAMAANTKVAGAAVWALCALFVLIEQIVKRRMKGRVWAVAAVTAVAFIGFYALLTPAMWTQPTAFASYLVQNALAFQRWQNMVLFRGAIFETWVQPLPAYYLPYMVVATTPLWLLGLIAAGGAAVLLPRLRGKTEALPLCLTLCLALLPLAFAVATRTHVYNGWRHFYFVYGPMMALAAWGLNRLSSHERLRYVTLLAAVCVLVQGVGIVREHPYQYAYYQPLVRARGADYNELDYWNVSVREALEALAQETQGEITLAATERWSENGVRKALELLSAETAQRMCLSENGQYVVCNATYVNFQPAFSAMGLEEKLTLTSYGQPILRIYERSEEAYE